MIFIMKQSISPINSFAISEKKTKTIILAKVHCRLIYIRKTGNHNSVEAVGLASSKK